MDTIRDLSTNAVRRRWMMVRIALMFLCCTMAASTSSALPAAPRQPIEAGAEINRAVQSLCSRQVVLLGEDSHHASATTISVKALIVRRLVEQCGFRGVVFESQFYDMLNFEHAIATKSATREQLSDAIGALWSHYAAFAPMEHWLFDEAKLGRVRVAGMDPQVGGVADHYSQQQLAGALSSVLSGKRRTECERTIRRHAAWEYDDAHPFDAAVMPRLRSCSKEIVGRLLVMGRSAPSGLSAMAESYANYLEFADGDQIGMRDRAMFKNLVWIRAHWPKDTRIVIWCASVHAAKTLEGVRPAIQPLGSYIQAALGDRAAAIGFSALGGSYGNVGGQGKAHALAVVAKETLEARAFADTRVEGLRFFDRRQLSAMGPVSSRALDYSKPYILDWSRVLDGIIVLRTETAATATH